MPFKGLQEEKLGSNVPDLYRPVQPRRYQMLPIAAEAKVHHVGTVLHWLANFFTGCRIPQLHIPVPSSGSQELTVQTERQSIDDFHRLATEFPFDPGCRIPNSDHPISVTNRDSSAAIA